MPELLTSYKNKSGNYSKSFLINKSINGNLWKSENTDLSKWIGKPGVLYYENGKMEHTPGETESEMKKLQKPYEVSTIIDTGIDENTGNAFAIEVIHDIDLFKKLQTGEIKYRSPGLMGTMKKDSSLIDTVDVEHPVHHAFVDEPAYGPEAKVVGTCTGKGKDCITQLAPLMASIEDSNSQNNISNRAEFVRTIPLISDIQDKQYSIVEKRDEELVASLRAEMDSMKKTIAELKDEKETANTDNNDKPDSKKANTEDMKGETTDEKKMAEIEDMKKEMDEEKKKTASLTKLIASSTIKDLLLQATNNGVDTKKLASLEKELQESDINSLLKTKSLVASFTPTIYH